MGFLSLLRSLRAQAHAEWIAHKYKNWRYKNTTLLIASVLLFVSMTGHSSVHTFINHLGSIGYAGAFFAGILFVSVFTVVPAGYVLFHIAQESDPLTIALLAALGAAFGDLLILKFLRDRVFDELYPLLLKVGNSRLSFLFRTPYFAWMVPLIGVLIIMLPMPDEAGIGLLGMSKFKTWQVISITFVLHFIGIFFVVLAARSFQ